MFKELVFNFRFDSKKHVHEYKSAIESLIRKAQANIYSGDDDLRMALESGTLPPTIDTSNGIRMIYSICRQNAITAHQVSVSRSPYLASRNAKHLMAFFSCLSGLPVSPVLFQSGPIYNIEYALDETQQEQLNSFVLPDDLDPKELFLRAFMESTAIQIEQ